MEGTYLAQCEIQAACDQTKGLSCSLTNDNVYVCLCSSYFYWSQTSLACVQQLTNGQTCVLTTDCKIAYSFFVFTLGYQKVALKNVFSVLRFAKHLFLDTEENVLEESEEVEELRSSITESQTE